MPSQTNLLFLHELKILILNTYSGTDMPISQHQEAMVNTFFQALT